MATIRGEIDLAIPADRAWKVLRDFGRAGELFAGVLVGCRRVGAIRTVTFANGLEVSERLVTVDDDDRRLVYWVLDGPFSHHSASMQIVDAGDGSKFVWISDFLPDEAAAGVKPLVDAGCEALKKNMETMLARVQ